MNIKKVEKPQNQKGFVFNDQDLFESKEEFVPFVSGSSKEELLKVINRAVKENIFSVDQKLEEDE